MYLNKIYTENLNIKLLPLTKYLSLEKEIRLCTYYLFTHLEWSVITVRERELNDGGFHGS